MNKKELRGIYKEKRLALSKKTRDKMSLQIANQLLLLEIWQYNTYHLFLSIEKLCEINTEYILDILYGKDKEVVVPKMDKASKTLSSILLTKDTQLITNSWGIAEPESNEVVDPEQIDVVFIPLLAYDSKGNRIGYGGGYYDRLLRECRSQTLKIGLSYFSPEDDFGAICHPSDMPLDVVVTPVAIYHFSSNKTGTIKAI